MHEPQAFVDLQDAGNAQAQLILQAIARHADWDTGEGYPKQETIARMAKCCERTVRSYVKKLEADGFIKVVERRRDDGGRASNIIRLVGYAEWISANRTGGKVAAPKAAKRYEQPPGKSCHGGEAKDATPTGNISAGAPGNMLAAQEHSLNDQIILSAQAREDSKFDLKSEVERFVRSIAEAVVVSEIERIWPQIKARKKLYAPSDFAMLKRMANEKARELELAQAQRVTERITGETV